MNRMLVNAERTISALLLLMLFLLIVAQVLSRYLFAHPFTWTEEVARYTMIWLIFIAAAQVTSTDGHIAITLIDKAVPGRMVKWVVVVSRLIVAGGCVALLPYGWRFVSRMFAISSPAASIPMGWVYLASFAGMVLIALHSLISALLVALDRIPATAPPEQQETGILEETAA